MMHCALTQTSVCSWTHFEGLQSGSAQCARLLETNHADFVDPGQTTSKINTPVVNRDAHRATWTWWQSSRWLWGILSGAELVLWPSPNASLGLFPTAAGRGWWSCQRLPAFISWRAGGDRCARRASCSDTHPYQQDAAVLNNAINPSWFLPPPPCSPAPNRLPARSGAPPKTPLNRGGGIPRSWRQVRAEAGLLLPACTPHARRSDMLTSGSPAAH